METPYLDKKIAFHEAHEIKHGKNVLCTDTLKELKALKTLAQNDCEKCNVSVCEPVGEALPEIITQIKKFEQEALKQAALAERDSCIESQMTSEAMAFAYRLCYELIEGSKH